MLAIKVYPRSEKQKCQKNSFPFLLACPQLCYCPAQPSPPSFPHRGAGGFMVASPSPAFVLVPPGALQALPQAAALQGNLPQLSRGCSSSGSIHLLCRGAFLRLQRMPAPAPGPPPSPLSLRFPHLFLVLYFLLLLRLSDICCP